MSTSTAPLAHYPHIQTVTVRFRDLDALGHVNNAVYLTYFESVRIDFYYELTGKSLADIDIILAETSVTYHAPAHFGDTLVIGARIASIGTKSFVMEYLAVREADQQVIARSRSVQVMYDYVRGRSIPVSDNFRARVAALQHDDGAGSMP